MFFYPASISRTVSARNPVIPGERGEAARDPESIAADRAGFARNVVMDSGPALRAVRNDKLSRLDQPHGFLAIEQVQQ
jgi:hypothetical protein